MSSPITNSGTKKSTKKHPLSGHFLKVQERKAAKNERKLSVSLDRLQAYCDSRNIARDN